MHRAMIAALLAATTLAAYAVILVRAPHGATAAGVGPTLAVGTPSLVAGQLQVPIVAGGTEFSPYTSANLDLRWDSTVFRFAGISTTGTIYQRSQCSVSALHTTSALPDADAAVISCDALSPTTAVGSLLAVLLTPLGTGCSGFHLVTAGPPDFGGTTAWNSGPISGSFTYDALGRGPQTNTYGPDVTAGDGGAPCVVPPGPTIAVGTPSLSAGSVHVPVLTTGVKFAAFNRFQIHLRWDPTLFVFLRVDAAGGMFDPSNTGYCDTIAPDPDHGGVIVNCHLNIGLVTASGLLATVILTPAASGCSTLHLVTYAAPDGGGASAGSYTRNPFWFGPPGNAYIDGTVTTMGTTCGTQPASTATSTVTPTSTATPATPPASTSTPSPTASPEPTSTPSPTGPTLAVGVPSLIAGKLQVPIVAQGTVVDAYNAYNLHLRWDPTLFTFSGASSNGLVFGDTAFCAPPLRDRDGAGVVVGCMSIGASTKNSGLLATILLAPVSPGCSVLHLFTFGPPDHGDTNTGTYTVNAADSTVQVNTYVDGTTDSTGAPCTPPPSPTPTSSPTATRTPTATSTPAPPTATSTPTLVPTPTGTIVAGQPQIFIMNAGICTALLPRITVGCTIYPASGLRYGPHGDTYLREVADLLGNNQGPVEPADFTAVDSYTAGEVHQLDGTAYMSLSSFPVIAFVRGNGPVLFSTTAGKFSESGTATWLCTGTGFYLDSDCGGPNASSSDPALGPDHAVVAYLSCTAVSCPHRGPQHLTVIQNGISYTRDFTVVGEPASVTLGPVNQSLEPGMLPTDPTTGALQCSAPLLAPGDLGRSKEILLAHALDADGREVTGAWLSWSTSDPRRAVVSGPLTPSLDLQGATGAPILVCVPQDASPGTVSVTAQITSMVAGILLDPFADTSASASTTLDITAPATVTPTGTPSPSPSPTASATPSLSASSTAVATATDTPAAVSNATSTAVATATNTPLVVSTATTTASPPGGITPASTLTQPAAATAPAQGVAATAPSPTFSSSVLGTSARSGTTLPNTGSPAAGARGALAGFLAALAVAAGLAAASTGWRMRRRGRM